MPQQEDKYTPNVWGTDGGLRDLRVPSGQLCLVKKSSLQGLMQAGILHDVDALTSLVELKHIARAQGKKVDDKASAEKILKNPKAIEALFHTVDRVVTHIVVKPEIHMTPNDVTNRKAGVVYADMIDIDDKMFIFNYAVGGTDDVATFRREAAQNMGSVDALEEPESATK